MPNTDKEKNTNSEKILKKLESFENRLERIETWISKGEFSKINLRSAQTPSEIAADYKTVDQTDDTSMEFKIGEYGLAWFGSMVLLFGITFLMSYTSNIGYSIFSSVIGYVAAAGVFALGYFLRHSFIYLVYMLNISAHLLVYYVTLRLHFFTPDPLISQIGIAVFLLLAVIGIQIYYAIRIDSKFLAGVALLLLGTTAIFTNTTHLMLPLLTVTSIVALYLFYRYEWWQVLVFSIFIVYFSHLIWFLGNPIAGQKFQLVETHQYNLFYLVAYFAIYSLITLLPRKQAVSDSVYLLSVIWNGVCFGLLLLLAVLMFFQNGYSELFIVLGAMGIAYSVILKTRTNNAFDIAFYACFGFMALSVALYGYSSFPYIYLWLALQSLLVISLAYWFRSKIIVIVNTLLYIGILLVYLVSAKSAGAVDFTFAIVALASARIMNWKKERFTLHTDMMRNLYLTAGFVTVLFGLYHVVPKEYVTLSWTAAAAGYFLLSILLHNIKYRWMAILTLLATGVYLFIVDLARMEMGYRVVAFLFLAAISIGVSLYYTKRLRKKKKS